MVDYNAVFDTFEHADPTGRGPKIDVDGKFLVEVEEVRLRESQNPTTQGHVYFVVQYRVLESDHEKIPSGRVFTWTNDLMNQFFGMSNCKQFLAAALGLEPSSEEARSLGKEHIQEAIEGEAFNGEKLCLATQNKTVNSGREITVHAWSPYVSE